MNDPKIIIALDYPDADSALALVDQLDPLLCRLKVGKQLFTAAGPGFVELLTRRGFAVFLDLKFHDIPTTVALACKAATNLGVWMMNVHALGGSTMMRAAREALDESSPRPLLIAVTLLTSMSEQDMQEIGLVGNPKDAVLRLASLTHAAGLDGVVCSAQEASQLKHAIPQPFCLVTPGIRPASAALGDQQRIMTPAAALAAGSDYLVIGRPITHAADPLKALQDIQTEISKEEKP